MAESVEALEVRKDLLTGEECQYEPIREGLAKILIPSKPSGAPSKSSTKKDFPKKDNSNQSVFYNPIQQFNRDLSVLAIRVYAEDVAAVQDQKAARGRANGEGKKARKRKRDEAFTEKDNRGVEKPKAVESPAAGPNASVGADGDLAGADSPNRTVSTVDGPPRGFEQQPCMESQEAQTSEPQHDQEEHHGAQHFREPPTGLRSEVARPHPAPRPFRVLDALSATGLRALRYAKEIPQVTFVAANDLDPSATAAIQRNVVHNGVGARVQPTTGSASAHMYAVGSESKPTLPNGGRGKYHVIDLDPYGTATPFLDAAVQALANGGLLGVTCTDAGVFASVAYAEKTFSLYGGLPLKGPHAHEGGIRLVLHAIASSAARYGIAIEPLLSLSIDFYVRVFVRLRHAPNEVKHLAAKTMVVYNCDSGCGAWSVQYLSQQQAKENRKSDTWWKFSLPQAPIVGPFCDHCGFKSHMGGPMWGGPLHNPFFVQRILDLLPSLSKETYGTLQRLEGMLTTARDEMILPRDLKVVSPVDKQPTPARTSNGAASPAPASGDAASKGPSASMTPDIPDPIPRLPPEFRDPTPFFILPSVLSRALATPSPSNDALRGALYRLGYRCSRCHTKPGSIRTDAPWAVVWEMMRRWARKHHPEGWVPGRDTVAWRIWNRGEELQRWKEELADMGKEAEDAGTLKKELQAFLWRLDNAVEGPVKNGDDAGKAAQTNTTVGRPDTVSPISPAAEEDEEGSGPEDDTVKKEVAEKHPVSQMKNPFTAAKLAALDIVFDEVLGREEPRKGMVRYQINPAPNWGPMSKAR